MLPVRTYFTKYLYQACWNFDGKFWYFPSLSRTSTNDPSNDISVHITALGGNYDITIPLNSALQTGAQVPPFLIISGMAYHIIFLQLPTQFQACLILSEGQTGTAWASSNAATLLQVMRSNEQKSTGWTISCLREKWKQDAQAALRLF
jgi:hypothetical protein